MAESRLGHSSFARCEEKKWNAEDSVSPGNDLDFCCGDYGVPTTVAGREVDLNVPDHFGSIGA